MGQAPDPAKEGTLRAPDARSAAGSGPAAPLVEVIVEAGGWDEPALAALGLRAAQAALASVGLPAEGFEIALLATDDEGIAARNAAFRGKSVPTNVLSWPSEERAAPTGRIPAPPLPGTRDDPESLGDIALGWETCVREANDAAKPLEAHLSHLVVHAVLHLLGYDHMEDADAGIMEAIEVRALARMGFADPYHAD